MLFSIYFPFFFQNRIIQKVFTAYIYQIKADGMPFPIQKKPFHFDKIVWVSRNWNLDIRCFMEFGEILGNPAYWMEDPWGLKD